MSLSFPCPNALSFLSTSTSNGKRLLAHLPTSHLSTLELDLCRRLIFMACPNLRVLYGCACALPLPTSTHTHTPPPFNRGGWPIVVYRAQVVVLRAPKQHHSCPHALQQARATNLHNTTTHLIHPCPFPSTRTHPSTAPSIQNGSYQANCP